MALCKGCGDIVMLAVGNICQTWKVPRVVALNLEVFLIVEGRGPFRGYSMLSAFDVFFGRFRVQCRVLMGCFLGSSLGHLVYSAI